MQEMTVGIFLPSSCLALRVRTIDLGNHFNLLDNT